MQVEVEKSGKVYTVIINRPEVKNAIDYETSRQLAEAFRAFESDGSACAAVLWGAHGTFCAGADLKALAADPLQEAGRLNEDMAAEGPLGPTRMLLSKPVIAAISGYCVAGGWSWPFGATSGWRRRTPCWGSSSAASGCRSSTAARSACPASSA